MTPARPSFATSSIARDGGIHHFADGYAADGDAEIVINSASGADDYKTVAVTMEIAANGTPSGLFATGGTAIFLFEENGLIVGRLAAADGSADPLGTSPLRLRPTLRQ